MEQWRDIKEFEGIYQVSDLGNVRSLVYSATDISELGKYADP